MVVELKSNKFKTLEKHTGTFTMSLKGDPEGKTLVTIDYGGGQGAPNVTLSGDKTYQVISTTENRRVTITNHGPQAINLSWNDAN